MADEIIEPDVDKVVITNNRDYPLTITDGNGAVLAVIPPRISSFGFELPEGAYLTVNT